MKGKLHPTNDVTINPSGNPSILDLIDGADVSRRQFIQTSLSASVLAGIGGVGLGSFAESAGAAPILPDAATGFPGIGFDSIPAKRRSPINSGTIPGYPPGNPPTISPPGVVPIPFADTVDVPPGYTAKLFVAWGDPIMPGAPAWAENATQTEAAQKMQYGMHNDGMHYFGFPVRGSVLPSSERGILCVNNEYTEENVLHGSEGLTGGAGVTLPKVRKSQAAHGVSIMEVRRIAGNWTVVSTSPFGRRITSNTPVRISGPAAGHPLMKSKKYDIQPGGSIEIGVNDGFEGNGTVNNCAHGLTPWGTYLTCEENWNGNFGSKTALTSATLTKLERRYGVTSSGFGYSWHVPDPRFDIRDNPLETNLFGWVVEIDPFDPTAKPVKRTALGRFKHESAQFVVGNGSEVAFYQGDDERNEYIYKFVCSGLWNRTNRAANKDLLDSGTLYVARFDAAGTGVWLPLTPGSLHGAASPLAGQPLRNNPEFAAATDAEVQALILIKTRMAADAVGATMMDRPEWAAVRTYSDYAPFGPTRPLEVYCTLTNNRLRGQLPASVNAADGSTTAASALPPIDAANPRPGNEYGHIIRWREDGHTPTATTFTWDIFVLAGDTGVGTVWTKNLPGTYNPAGHDNYQGNIVDVPNGSADFGAPDGLWFDYFGRLWIQTDQAGTATGDFRVIGSNAMFCADPNSKEIRRFLTSPPGCEVTGVVTTPDGKTMWVGIQHPGEGATAVNPVIVSNWPQSQFATNSAGVPLPNTVGTRRPRSSVVVITKDDGGVIGN
jgi:secreted PhoX family phosphatase